MFALVSIKKFGSRRFTYKVPEGLTVRVGDPVKVQVKNQDYDAVVAQLLATCPLPEDRVRELRVDRKAPPVAVVDPKPTKQEPRKAPVSSAPQRMSKMAFFRDVGYLPHVGQGQIHGALELGHVRHVVAVCGTRFGKTMCAAHEMAFEAVRPQERTTINPHGEFKGWCVGPTHDKAKIVFDMIVKILRDYLKGHVRVNNSDGVIEFTNLGGTNSIIKRRTTQDAAGKGRLVGEAVNFMVIDEAASIKDPEIWQGQLSTRLVDRKGRSLHISSPRGVEGYFAQLYRSAESDESVIGFKLPTWVNPHIDQEELIYLRTTMPRRRFDAEVGAELLANSSMVFDKKDLEQMFVLDFEQPRPEGDYFAAIDLAVTNDYTVLTIARAPFRGEKPQKPRVVIQERFYKMPIEVQLSRMHALLMAYNDCTATVDHNGIGQSIFQQMVNRGMSVRPLYTTGQGANSKRDIVFNAVAVCERQAILLPKRELVPSFWDEMLSYQWEETPSGQLTANGPSGAHDDCVSSFLLLCHWIRAAGTTGDGLVYRAGQNETPVVAPGVPRPELVARGDALPEDEDPQVYNPGRRSDGRGAVRVDARGRRSGIRFRLW